MWRPDLRALRSSACRPRCAHARTVLSARGGWLQIRGCLPPPSPGDRIAIVWAAQPSHSFLPQLPSWGPAVQVADLRTWDERAAMGVRRHFGELSPHISLDILSVVLALRLGSFFSPATWRYLCPQATPLAYSAFHAHIPQKFLDTSGGPFPGHACTAKEGYL